MPQLTGGGCGWPCLGEEGSLGLEQVEVEPEGETQALLLSLLCPHYVSLDLGRVPAWAVS